MSHSISTGRGREQARRPAGCSKSLTSSRGPRGGWKPLLRPWDPGGTWVWSPQCGWSTHTHSLPAAWAQACVSPKAPITTHPAAPVETDSLTQEVTSREAGVGRVTAFSGKIDSFPRSLGRWLAIIGAPWLNDVPPPLPAHPHSLALGSPPHVRSLLGHRGSEPS